jgi:hypothetical protein
VASRVRLTEGSAYAVLVGDPSRAQSVRDIETLSCGDLITGTEHGWYDFMTKHADHLPALVELHPAAQG